MTRGRKLLTVEVTVYDDRQPPDCRTTTYGSSFVQVQRGLRVAVENIQGRIDHPEECPLNPEERP